MRAVCREAGVSPRYFYESFANLDQLLVAVFDEVIEEGTRAVLAALDAAPEAPRDKARAAIATWIGFITEDPRRIRVIYLETAGSDTLTQRRIRSLPVFARLIAAQTKALYDTPAGTERALNVSAFMLVGGLSETLLAWLTGDLEATREQLIDDCTDFVLAVSEATIASAPD